MPRYDRHDIHTDIPRRPDRPEASDLFLYPLVFLSDRTMHEYSKRLRANNVPRRLSYNSSTETPPVPDFAELTAAPSAPPPCPPGMPTCNRRFQKTTYSKIPYTLRGSELILAERKQSPYTDIKISLLSRRCPRQGITGHCRKCFRRNASFHAWIFL